MEERPPPVETGPQEKQYAYIIAGIFYLLLVPLLLFISFLTVLMCVSDKCVRDNLNFPFLGSLVSAAIALLIAIFAFIWRKYKPRWFSWLMILFPFLYLAFYIAGLRASNLL